MEKLDVTRDVITDLLPLYFAGECSPDTIQLVESWFARDPEMAERARRLSGTAAPAQPGPSAEKEKRALRRARWIVGIRMTILAYAMAFTLSPMAMTFDRHGLRWLMLRDNPVQAGIFFIAGIVCWIVYGILAFQLRRKWA